MRKPAAEHAKCKRQNGAFGRGSRTDARHRAMCDRLVRVQTAPTAGLPVDRRFQNVRGRPIPPSERSSTRKSLPPVLACSRPDSSSSTTVPRCPAIRFSTEPVARPPIEVDAWDAAPACLGPSSRLPGDRRILTGRTSQGTSSRPRLEGRHRKRDRWRQANPTRSAHSIDASAPHDPIPGPYLCHVDRPCCLATYIAVSAY